RESFTYNQDVRVLEQYYQDLWRIYIFVSPSLFQEASRCKAVIDKFAEIFGLSKIATYKKVRTHKLQEGLSFPKILQPILEFIDRERGGLQFVDTPTYVLADFVELASRDDIHRGNMEVGRDPHSRLIQLFNSSVLRDAMKRDGLGRQNNLMLRRSCKVLDGGADEPKLALVARSIVGRGNNYLEYKQNLVDALLRSDNQEQQAIADNV